jgi:peptidoglycan/LPS O-acetylase OafA/YrhL
VSTSAKFNPRLESIRGLAALMVAGSHSLLVYPTTGVSNWVTNSMRLVLNGDAAVTMFFLLSGLVLGMGLQREGKGSAQTFLNYAIRRMFRIYPVFFVSTIVVLTFLFLGQKWFGNGGWFNHVSTYRKTLLNTEVLPSKSLIRDNLLLMNSTLNIVTWTLGVELFCSLMLPFTHFARLRMPASGLWMILLACFSLVFLSKWFLLLGWIELEGSFNWSIFGFLFLFYLGYLLPILGPQCFSRFKPRPRVTRVLFLLFTMVWLSANSLQDTYRIGAGLAVWGILGLLLYGADLREFKLLDSISVRKLGKISYSFYLLHDLVLVVIARCVAQWIFHAHTPASPLLSNIAIAIVSIAMAALLASVAHRFVELPGIRCGKFLCERLRTRFANPLPSPSIVASR